MSESMLDTITGLITPSLTSRLGSLTGDSQSAVTKGFAGTIPAVLGMVTSRADDPGFMNQVSTLARDPTIDPTLIDDPNRLLDRVTASTAGSGGPFDRFRSMIVGNNPTGLLGTISSYAGVRSTTASSILSMAIPMVLGCIGKMIRRDGLDSAALGRRLASEQRSVSSAIPSAFSSFIPGAKQMAGVDELEAEDYVTEDAYPARRRSALPWVTAALALAAVWGLFFIGRQRVTEQAEQMVGTAGAYATRLLPGGISLRIPAAGSEEKLLSYAASSAPISSDAWIEFDRLTFETDSSRVTSDSRDQLLRIATILRAYPNVHLKIGGYTDNSGDPAANLKLSQDRATTVMNELVTMGIPPDRLEAQGYGETNAVASNATEEGREQNRRVAFRVTAH
jgi:OOP family OmpA-OmpF porin